MSGNYPLMNEKVAMKIMDWERYPMGRRLAWVNKLRVIQYRNINDFRPTLMIEDAMEVLEKLAEKYVSVDIQLKGIMYCVMIVKSVDEEGKMETASSPLESSLPLAICKAAMRAVKEDGF